VLDFNGLVLAEDCVEKFQSFWFGDELGLYPRLAMKSFVDRGHSYVLYAYKKFDVPNGIELRDAAEILPASRVFFYGDRAGIGRGSVAGFANLFRYALLQRFGNWWVDTDVVCISDTVPTTDLFTGWEDAQVLGNAILKFPAGHPLANALLEGAEQAGTDLAWGTTGPLLVTRLAREMGLADQMVAPAIAYPLRSFEALDMFIPSRRDALVCQMSDAPLLHLWNEEKRRAGLLPQVAPPPGSFMAELFERHKIGFGDALVYTLDQIERLRDSNAAFKRGPALAARAETAESEVIRLTELVAAYERLLAAYERSTSWRVTAPVRWLGRLRRRET
jgi:hypothetical protein